MATETELGADVSESLAATLMQCQAGELNWSRATHDPRKTIGKAVFSSRPGERGKTSPHSRLVLGSHPPCLLRRTVGGVSVALNGALGRNKAAPGHGLRTTCFNLVASVVFSSGSLA